VAQTISYEVTMTVILLGSVLYYYYDLGQEKGVAAVAWMCPLALILVVRVLAEANRSPFDFAEGESELVSGYNTEYASVLFVMLFLAEYMSILFMSLLCALTYLSATYTGGLAGTILTGGLYVWARGTLPRFRYDQLIYTAWKCLLPSGLVLLALGTLL